MRFYDSEASSGHASDVIVWETSDLRSYQDVVEELRELILENAYADCYEVDAY